MTDVTRDKEPVLGETDSSEPAEPEEKSSSPGRRRFLRWLILRASILAPIAGYSYAIEPDQVRVANVVARVPGLPKAANGLRIGHLSDTHCDSDRAVNRAAAAARLLMAQMPDMVVITGDYITHDPRLRMPQAARALALLAAAPLGAFAVLGNHDWWAGEPDFVAEELSRTGFRVLRNQSVRTKAGFWLVGLDQRCDDQQNAERALRDVPSDSTKLLLIHEPDYADEAPPGFSLQFSGHSHGGQVRIPLLPPIITPTYGRRYPEGLRQARHHLVYTTRGVGMVRPQFRLCCPPEVGVVRLVAA